MATVYKFGNQVVKLPGAYATIVSGDQAQPLAVDYGKVLIIDTGDIGAGYVGGSGISGELASNKDAVYKFTDLASLQSFVKGGLFWKSAEALFKPDPITGALGVSEVIFAKAATTTAALMTFTATGGGANGGTFKVKTRDEGTWSNGVLTATHLDKGYAYKIETGEIDVNKWVFKIYRGSWKGDHTDGIAFDEIPKADAEELILAISPEFDNIQTLIDWANEDAAFNALFALDPTSAVAGDGSVDATDVAAVTGYQVATGGTETYASAQVDLVLDAVAEENYAFVLTDKYGTANYQNADLAKVVAHNLSDAKFQSLLFYGGGKDSAEFSATNGSIDQATYFNSAYVHVVHADVGTATTSLGEGFRRWPSFIHASFVLGRTAGKEPQVPVTNKTIGVDKLYHSLSKKDKERALDAGVISTIIPETNRSRRAVVLQGVNTLQDNRRLQTPQGKSFQISIMRIQLQLNSELIVNAESGLLNDENGVNVNTLSANRVRNFMETYLESRTATATTDNLILSFGNLSVTRDGDAWLGNYEFVPNNEINKIFFTGFQITT